MSHESARSFARTALNTGMNVAEITNHLVSRGLSPGEADRIVMGVLQGDVAENVGSLSRTEWARPISLLVSLVIGAACVLLAYWFGVGFSIVRCLLWLVPALGGIWLPVLTDTKQNDPTKRSEK